MDQAPLVNNDIEVEAKVVSALSRADIPVTAVEWTWVPQLDEFQLVVVSRWVDERGPREVYIKILAALKDAGVYDSIPLRKLFVKGPNDPVAQKLIEEIKQVTEGSVHILKHRTRARTDEYSLVFAPYLGSGGSIPSKQLTSSDDLRHFLEKQLAIPGYVVDQALTELGQKDSTTIFNVQLSLRRARKLNLAA